MENIISEKLIQVISENEKKFSNDTLMSSYESAIKEFDELIEKGFAKKRESNLLSITESHLHRITLETYINNFTQHGFRKNGSELHSINIRTKTNFRTFNEF
ncbi:MAG: hypothetical protein QM530_05480 [Phycisphaerales bacterium]|nr:hypothetical protein [Phycisphaerales bacterium]